MTLTRGLLGLGLSLATLAGASCSRPPTVLITVEDVPPEARSLHVIPAHMNLASLNDLEPFELPQPTPKNTTFLLRLPDGLAGAAVERPHPEVHLGAVGPQPVDPIVLVREAAQHLFQRSDSLLVAFHRRRCNQRHAHDVLRRPLLARRLGVVDHQLRRSAALAETIVTDAADAYVALHILERDVVLPVELLDQRLERLFLRARRAMLARQKAHHLIRLDKLGVLAALFEVSRLDFRPG